VPVGILTAELRASTPPTPHAATNAGRRRWSLRVWCAAMVAIKPWQLSVCLIVVVLVAGAVVALIRAGRRK